MSEHGTEEQAQQDAPAANWQEMEPGVPATCDTIPGGSTDDPSRTDPTRVPNQPPGRPAGDKG
jgi:hypothetical protein